MDVCLRVLKKATKVGSTTTVSVTVFWSYPILPFGIVACTFFSKTFLEVAVYKFAQGQSVTFFNITYYGVTL